MASLGAIAAAAVLARSQRVNVMEWLCLAWLFGVGTVSLLLWIGSTFSSGLILRLMVTGACLLSGVAGGWMFRKHGARVSFFWPNDKLELVLTAVLLAQVAAILYASAGHTLGWDGLLVWEIKARYAFLNHGVLPAAYFTDAGRVFSHPDYPLAIPLTELWLYLGMGEENQFWAKLIFPVFYTVGAGLLALLGARLTGSRCLGLLLAVFLFFVPQVTVAAGGVLVGYADVPLSIIYLAAIGYLLCALRRRGDGSFAIFAICLALLPWMKREGAILWGVACLAAALVLIAQRRSPRFWLALLPGSLVLGAWKLFLVHHGAVTSLDFSSMSLSLLGMNSHRMIPILNTLLAEMARGADWGIFWGLAVLALAAVILVRPSLSGLLLASAIVLPIALYSVTYLFSAWPDYLDHVNASIPRLIVHVVPVALLLVGVAVQSVAVARRGVAVAAWQGDPQDG